MVYNSLNQNFAKVSYTFNNFLVSHKDSGLLMYHKFISIFKNQNEMIISGFVQAISIFSESLIEEDILVKKKKI